MIHDFSASHLTKGLAIKTNAQLCVYLDFDSELSVKATTWIWKFILSFPYCPENQHQLQCSASAPWKEVKWIIPRVALSTFIQINCYAKVVPLLPNNNAKSAPWKWNVNTSKFPINSNILEYKKVRQTGLIEHMMKTSVMPTRES